MKRVKLYLIATFTVLTTVVQVNAGNPQRSGSAGASELLINPFARSSGWAGVSLGGVRGSNAMFVNVAGMAFLEKTELRFENTQWLVGSGIQINSLSFLQRVGDNGVLGIGVNGFDYGEWEVTTASQPDGTSGIISPSSMVINVAYASKFTESIYGGINIKAYSSRISNMSTMGLCFDAGVQYIPEADDRWKFGITLKNIGTALEYSGDGQSVTLPVPTFGSTYTKSWEEKSAAFELPTQLAMGLSHDFLLGEGQRFTAAGAFTSNSFESDFFQIGGEYSFKEILMVRAGYKFWTDSEGGSATAMTGLSAGVTFQIPLSQSNNSVLGLDYSYRATNPFQGVHSAGIIVGL